MRIFPSLVLGCYALTALCLTFMAFAPAQEHSETTPPALRLTVVTPAYDEATSLIAPFGPGYEQELLAEFCKNYTCDIRWTKAADRDTAIGMVRGGRADLAVGFAGPEVQRPGLAVGPAYYHASEVQVSTTGGPTVPAQLRRTASAEDIPPTVRRAIGVEDAPVLMADSPSERQFLLNARVWSLWEPFSSLVSTVEAKPGEGVDHHWFWNTRHASLNYGLTVFWTRLTGQGDGTLRRLDERYYGYLPESINPYAVRDLMIILKNRLPRYSNVIASASNKADIDPLLFTAVIIQESGMDEGTVSHTGVRGIMQLTTATASYLGVDRLNPTSAIGGGARYLNMLWKDLEGLGLDPWDRWFFTLAAFNQGPRRLEGAMELSRKLGGTGRTWEELKEIFPLLSQKKYASMVGQSVCRGQEAVNFVERVRLSYHIIRGLVALERPEAKNLAPLLRNVSLSSLGL